MRARFLLYWGCILAVQAVVTLAAVELLLRLVDLRYLRIETSAETLPYQYDKEIGWTPIAGAAGTLMGSRAFAVRQNSLGLRDIEHDGTPKPAIVFLGDSLVWGFDAQADELFTAVLRRSLPQYRIVNAGVAGYGTDQEYLFLRRLWSKFDPRVVVLMFSNATDRSDNTTNVRRDSYYKPYVERSPGGGWQFRGQPVPRSKDFYFAENWFARHLALGRLAASVAVYLRHPVVTVPDPTEYLITLMRDHVEASGAKFLMGLQAPDPQLEGFLQVKKIPYVTFPGAAQYVAGGNHWTPAGHVWVAERLRWLFAQEGVIPADPKRHADITIADYDEVIRHYPKDSTALQSRGAAYASIGLFDRAIIDYDESIRLDPRDAWAFYMRSQAHRASAKLDRAIADLDEAIRLNPTVGEFFKARGEAYAAKKDYERATADYDEARRRDPSLVTLIK
jgi:tetratricopeptide (TPR) repeat protein